MCTSEQTWESRYSYTQNSSGFSEMQSHILALVMDPFKEGSAKKDIYNCHEMELQNPPVQHL